MLCSFARVIPRSVAFVVPGLQGDIPCCRIHGTMRKTSMVIGLFIALLTLSPKVDAGEQPHFHGKTIRLQVGAQAGGRQDLIARTLAKYLMKYTPDTPAF